MEGNGAYRTEKSFEKHVELLLQLADRNMKPLQNLTAHVCF